MQYFGYEDFINKVRELGFLMPKDKEIKGYIAPDFYSVFLDAFHPRLSMEERYEAGKLGTYEWKFWSLLTKENRPIGTHEYRRMIETGDKGKSALDAAVEKINQRLLEVSRGLHTTQIKKLFYRSKKLYDCYC